jgi:hypothetical protein
MELASAPGGGRACKEGERNEEREKVRERERERERENVVCG